VIAPGAVTWALALIEGSGPSISIKLRVFVEVGISVDSIEDIAVLAGLLVFSSLSLAVIVLMY
jgi:shikimate kinase